MPQSRDRHPRLSAGTQEKGSLPKPLKRRRCCLTGRHIGVNERTDEGVCPYSVALSLMKGTPLSKRRGRSIVFSSATPANEALPHYTPTIHHFISKQFCLLPSPFGEGLGVRLLLSPWGRLVGVLTTPHRRTAR